MATTLLPAAAWKEDPPDDATTPIHLWAVVSGGDLWLWDAQGTVRRFGVAQPNQPAVPGTLCWDTHGTAGVDDFLTPLFAHKGSFCHSDDSQDNELDEDCFCGEDEPHVHAHWRSPTTCGGLGARNHHHDDSSIARLATLLLRPQADEPPGLPWCLASSHWTQQAQAWVWQAQAPCDACPSAPSVPRLQAWGQRAWKDAHTGRLVKVDCFRWTDPAAAVPLDAPAVHAVHHDHSHGGHEKVHHDHSHGGHENACDTPVAKKDSCCSDKSTTKSSCCDDEPSTKSSCCDDTPTTKSSCCDDNPSTKSSCCDDTSAGKSSCCANLGEEGIAGGTKASSCCGSNEASQAASGCTSKSACCTKDEEANTCTKSVKVDEVAISACQKGCCGNDTATFVEPALTPSPHDEASTATGRSQFRVGNICCASEIPLIHRILDGTIGITKIAVNPTTKTVYVDHDTLIVSAAELASALNRKGMGAEILLDASERLSQQHQKSLFVVSKLKFDEDETVRMDTDRITLVLQSLAATQVESFVLDARSRSLTVVHNPWTIQVQEIQSLLQDGFRVKFGIILDGVDQNREPLDYAALAASKINPLDEDQRSRNESRLPRPTVMLSGIFWAISMLSFIGGNFKYLKYVALISVSFGLPPIVRKAIASLQQRFRFDANGLMLMASIGALALGEFPEAGAVVFLFALSEWLEARASARARQALSAIVQLRPDKARLIDPETQQLWTVPATAVPVGALVSIKTGDQVPCDGIVIEGQSTVDESSLTGESRPILKGPKDSVSGGTVNSGMSQLVVRTTSTSEDSAVSRLIRLVEEAQINRSETEKSIDEFAKFYTPIVLLSATLMCTIPWAYGPDTGRDWTHNGLVLIVIACPCALIISTPVTYVAGLAATAQRGILIKGGAFLESLGQVTHICFDKTGTLTTGDFCLLHMDVVGDSLSREQVLQYLSLMEERAAHPVAQAILMAARNENVAIPADMILEKHTILAGEGVTGVINGHDVFVGNERLFQRLDLLSTVPTEVLTSVNSWKELGGTIGYISVQDYGIVGCFCAADGVRPEAAAVVQKLQSRGISLTMLTGDNEQAAQSVGKQLKWQVDKNDIRAKLLPSDKLTYVEELTLSLAPGSSCRRKTTVLFCGDGVNDAPALAAAHVGVAMGSGATLAMETAHVTLLDPSLEKLDFALHMGRRVMHKIVENVIFSVAVKAAVLVWALTGTPSLWAAIGSDVGSMLLVTLNAMRLLPAQKPPSSQKTASGLDMDKLM